MWKNTSKFNERQKQQKNKAFDLERLKKYEEDGHTPFMGEGLPSFIKEQIYAPAVRLIVRMDPKKIPLEPCACIGCTLCGLYNRNPFCSPDHPTLSESTEIIHGYKKCVVLISQNDGTFPWNDYPTKLSHIEFKKRESFALKGAEAGTSRYLQAKMKKIEHGARKAGFSAQATITGHCSLCGRCILKSTHDKNNRQLPCILGGLPSLESLWVNVYRWFSHGELGEVFEKYKDHVWPMKFVCDTHFTLITSVLYDKNTERKYWYPEHVKRRMKDEGVKEAIHKLKPKIKQALQKRAEKGIPR